MFQTKVLTKKEKSNLNLSTVQQKNSVEHSNLEVVDIEVDSNGRLIPYQCKEIPRDYQNSEHLNTDNHSEEPLLEPEASQEPILEETTSNASTSAVKTEEFASASDDEVYIIEDERYTIDQDGNRVKYDKQGSKTYVTEEEISMTSINKNSRVTQTSKRNEERRYSTCVISNNETTNNTRNKRKNSDEIQRDDKSSKYDDCTETREDVFRDTAVFGNYVTEQLRSLKNEELRTIAKFKITNCLLELQMKQLEERKKNSQR